MQNMKKSNNPFRDSNNNLTTSGKMTVAALSAVSFTALALAGYMTFLTIKESNDDDKNTNNMIMRSVGSFFLLVGAVAAHAGFAAAGLYGNNCFFRRGRKSNEQIPLNVNDAEANVYGISNNV